jgi:hypothetical protein
MQAASAPAASRSSHGGLVGFAVADGSNRFIAETIDFRLVNEFGTHGGGISGTPPRSPGRPGRATSSLILPKLPMAGLGGPRQDWPAASATTSPVRSLRLRVGDRTGLVVNPSLGKSVQR